MPIEWDTAKATANLKCHGVAFSEAATVLTDDFALTREDRDSAGGQRFVTLGMRATGSLLVVVYTHRGSVTYRLISSWKANKLQRKTFDILPGLQAGDSRFTEANPHRT